MSQQPCNSIIKLYKRSCLCCLALIFLPLFVFPQQQNTEALKKLLAKLPDDTTKLRILVSLSEETREGNIAQAEQYALQALQIADTLKSGFWVIKSLVQMGWVAGIKGNYYNAMRALNQADSVLLTGDFNMLKAEILLAKGRVQFERHYLAEAMESYFEALRLYEKAGDSLGVAQVCSNAGALKYFSGDYYQSQFFLKRAEPIARKSGNLVLLSQVLSNQSNNYGIWAKYDSSNRMLNEALNINQKLENFGMVAKVYTNLAMNYYEQNRFDSALQLFSKAYMYDSLWQNPVGVLYSYINMAAAFRKLNNPQKALQLASVALENAGQLRHRHLQKTILEDIAEIYADLGDHKKAFQFHRAFSQIKDSILNAENARIMADMQTRYEVDKREETVLLLQARQRQNQILVYGLIGVAVVLLVAGLSQYQLHKQKIRQAAEQLKFQEQELAGIASSMLQKDELIEEITSELATLKNESNRQRLDQLEELLHARVSTQEDWTKFQTRFELLHPVFFTSLQTRFPQLTPTEVKICVLEKLGLKDSQAGDLLGVNPESIRKGRYRLRKNMDDAEWEALRSFLQKG